MNIFTLIKNNLDYAIVESYQQFKELQNMSVPDTAGIETRVRGIMKWVIPWGAMCNNRTYISIEKMRSFREFALAASIDLEGMGFVPSLTEEQFVILPKMEADTAIAYFTNNAFTTPNYAGPCYIKKVAQSANLALLHAIY